MFKNDDQTHTGSDAGTKTDEEKKAEGGNQNTF